MPLGPSPPLSAGFATSPSRPSPRQWACTRRPPGVTSTARRNSCEVTIERARRYKTSSFAAHDAIVDALAGAGTMATAQVQGLFSTALGVTAYLWQVSHPTATLAELYAQEPRWAHAALDFEPRLSRLLQAAAGLAITGSTRSDQDERVPDPPG
ncbi:hypothetical protein ACQPZA_18960 [Pseudonocardia xinjiangensis]|uniref:hypothetical protein n=1 Tax=Pseudonocardia xinjiangensis TaxID=75289 RepID=UPI003D8B3575